MNKNFVYQKLVLRLGCALLVATTVLLNEVPGSGQEIVDQWRYTLRRPADGWHKVDFNDSGWQEGGGGFGSRQTPNARIGTAWNTNSIWLRKSFTIKNLPPNPALLIHHDEDAQVFINGQKIAELKGFTTNYKVIPVPKEDRDAIKTGSNLMAVNCRQTTGGQFIDVHLVDADHVPELPAPKRNTKPFVSDLITKWGEGLTADNAWTEYPRPMMKRDNWQNLNGHWDYAITPIEQAEPPQQWTGKILVPYCLESKLGGVQRLLDQSEALWYRRFFTRVDSEKTLLNFEAVDYRCQVFVNGKSVGEHQGGNTPFSFDVSRAIKSGKNELVVRVEDEQEGFQLHGKQTTNPRGIWYTQVSGIWQTVWLEPVARSYISDLKISTDAATGRISVLPIVEGRAGKSQLVVHDGDQQYARRSGESDRTLSIELENAKLWSPESPHLYSLEITLYDDQGNVLDRVESYAGIRTIGEKRGDDGHCRFTLNGEEIFHWGPLDQGWWPDGLLTPPSDEAMLFDIEWLKSAGFNMIRKHIKVEPRRYYYHCDRLGMMVWQDHVAGGPKPKWTRLQPNPVDATWPDEQHQQFMTELQWMVDTLSNHPSIVCWVPFNESWGQHKTVEVGRWLAKYDPSRSVNVASGGNFWPAGDVVDAHKYPHPEFPFDQDGGRFEGFIKVMGEFGGHGYPVKGHLWDANRRNWGYGGLPENEAEYKQRFADSLKMLNELRVQGIAGGVYTQTTDVEGEINGLMTYDRKVIKIPANELAELSQVLFGETKPKTNRPQNAAATSRPATVGDRPGPVMDAETIRAGMKRHDRALYIKSGWIRDPYIVLGPDDYFYLTGTQPNPDDPREAKEPYNTGLGPESIVGENVRLWRSKDLIEWESLGSIFNLEDSDLYQAQVKKTGKKPKKRLIWAPEVHFLGERWALVHCPKKVSSLALSGGSKLTGPWTHPMGENLGERHDPSLFQDDDGTVYLLWQNTMVAPLSKNLSSYMADPVRIDPAGSRPGPDGEPISRIGHEGATMLKIGGKYVHLGTAWSTDRGRKGSYNLYYCTAEKITGPYGPRKFAGRFLGHGTPFQDKAGKWWCTAFFNGNVPPLPRDGIEKRDLSETAQTINQQGVTIVPLDVKILADGEIYVRAKDPAYSTPGPDEAQKFELE